MYPLHYFSLFPVFPKNLKVFVAMSFDERFDSRWETVIQPAIGQVEVGGTALVPFRVDARQVCDSVLSDILTGIGKCRLFLADMSTVGYLPPEGSEKRPIRNANVLYEVGIAHATRLPEEVILVRSDNDVLNFDVTNIRVHSYDPDKNPEEAQNTIAELVLGALREIDLQRHLAVEKATSALDFPMLRALLDATASGGKSSESVIRNVRDAISSTPRAMAISRLLEFGMLRTGYNDVAAARMAGGYIPAEAVLFYELTPFGMAVLESVTTKGNWFPPEWVARYRKVPSPKKGATEEDRGSK